MALDNARLYRERDRIASNLQRGPAPAAAGRGRRARRSRSSSRRPASGIEIGGDVYDVLPTEDGCWVLIGDVAGKGSAAAGVSVAVRHAVRGLTREIDEPEEVLQRVNELLLDGTSLNDFATAVLIRLRRDEDGWRLVARRRRPPAGDPRRRGEATRQLGGGAVLGAWPEADDRAPRSARSAPATPWCSAPTAGSRPGRSAPTATPRRWPRWRGPWRSSSWRR